jgi:hypothetical protein
MADSRNAVARDVRPTAKAASEARTWRSTRSDAGVARRLAEPPPDPAGNASASSSAASSSAAAWRAAANPAASMAAFRARPGS